MTRSQQPRTSVVIPCYRHDEFLMETLHAARSQSVPPCQIVVIDDGSPTPLQKPEDWHGPELVWVRTANQGLGAARNEGVRHAAGEFIAFVDADDYWAPSKLELQQQHLDDHPDSVACYTRCVKADGFYEFGPYPDPLLERDQLAGIVWYGQFFPPSSLLVRADTVKQVGGFREGLRNGEDLDFLFRLFEEGQVTGVEEPLTYYREHEGQITKSEVRRILGSKEARAGIIEKYSHRLIAAGISPDRFWDPHRSRIVNTFYRRDFRSARTMLWDFWKEHPGDLQVLKYLLLTGLPPRWVSGVRD